MHYRRIRLVDFTKFLRISILYTFAITAAGVVAVQIIFSSWPFEISEDILRNQKLIICLDSFPNQR